MRESVTHSKSRQYKTSTVWCVFGMSWGSLALGYAAAVIGTTLAQPSFTKYMGLDTASNATQIYGAMNALFYVGGFLGSFFNSWFADHYGRKVAITTGAAIILASSALLAGSVNIAMFIVFRFTTGFGVLMLIISVPLWITEFVPPENRGGLATIHAVMINIGYVVSAYVGVGFFFWKSASGNEWRVPLALGCLPALFNLMIIPFVPESPRYLLIRGRVADAWKIIRDLHSCDDDPDHSYARSEFQAMQNQIQLDNTLDSSWRIMLTRPSYRKRVLIACSLLSFFYSTGVLVIANYGPELFKDLGFGAEQSLLFQAGNILQGLSAVFLSVFIMDLIPRNVLLATGMMVNAVTLSLVAGMNASFLGTENHSGLAAGIAFIFVYIWFYGFLLDGVGYFYAAEIFPTHLRAKGTTCCLAAYCLVNILWLQVAPTAFASIGWKFYMVFISMAVIGSITMYFYFPDTRNKPLEEVARLFGDEDLSVVYQDELHVTKSSEEKIGLGEVEELQGTDQNSVVREKIERVKK